MWRERAQRAGEKVQAIVLALLGLVACLHGEGSARGPSDPSIAGSEAGLIAVTSLDDTDEATRAGEMNTRDEVTAATSAVRDPSSDGDEDSASAEADDADQHRAGKHQEQQQALADAQFHACSSPQRNAPSTLRRRSRAISLAHAPDAAQWCQSSCSFSS